MAGIGFGHIGEMLDKFLKENAELHKENERLEEENRQLSCDLFHAEGNLAIMIDLAEERRLALEACVPQYGTATESPWCYFCNHESANEHESDCDYVRLTKEDVRL